MDAAPLKSLVATGTKLWLDSIDPDEVARTATGAARGATSNPIIIADLIKTGRFDEHITQLIHEGLDDEDLAWRLTDNLVRQAQEVFLPVWEADQGQRRLRQLRAGPAARRRRASTLSVAERTAQLRRAGQAMEPGPQEPHD